MIRGRPAWRKAILRRLTRHRRVWQTARVKRFAAHHLALPSPALALALALALLLGLLSALPAGAQLGSGQIRGRAPQAVTTALLDFAGQPVHLYGLRGLAPDATCRFGGAADGPSWPCGREARWAARDRIAGHWVDCVERARGPAGELSAVCYLGGVGGPELNAWLVEQGWATATGGPADDYVAAEASAKAAGRGIWRRR